MYNRRYANTEKKISPATVSNLSVKWKFSVGGDITVTPAIAGDSLSYTKTSTLAKSEVLMRYASRPLH